MLFCLTANLIFAQTKKIDEVNTFKIKNSGAILNNEKDVDGDGDIDADDKAKLLALAKAYVSIMSP